MDWTTQLVECWKNDGLPIAEGASEEEISSFERDYRVRVPKAFREYLLAVNGMVHAHDSDGRLFAFWPLARIKPVLPEYPAYPDGLRDCFMFADFMIRSFEYAINMDAESQYLGSVTLIGGAGPQFVSQSFPDFIDLYLRDARELYGSK